MTDLWHITHGEMVLRLLLAVALGGLIGLEREWNNHAAGFRTHILVCIGSTVIMLLSIYGFSAFANEGSVRMDPARLAAQVISGIGFLGAGAILRTGSTISGLTTAASVWVVAAIGLCVGAGFYFVSTISTLLVLISLFVLNKLEKRWVGNRRAMDVVVKLLWEPASLGRIVSLFGSRGIAVSKLQLKPDDSPESGDAGAAGPRMELHFTFKNPDRDQLLLALGDISLQEGVVYVQSYRIQPQLA